MSDKKEAFEAYQNLQQMIAIYNEMEKTLENQNTQGVYHSIYHKVQINPEIDPLKKIHILLHECVHSVIGETFIGYMIGDYQQILQTLIDLSQVKRVELITRYLARFDSNIDVLTSNYPMENPLELDVVLSQYEEYVDYCEFCLRIYLIVKTLHENSLLLNEGAATFISCNYSDEKFQRFYPYFDIIEQDSTLKNALKLYQYLDKKTIRSQQDSPYKVGYNLAENIYDKFGEDGFILSVLAATRVPYHSYDLMGCSFDELKKLLYTVYDCDVRWHNFSQLDEEYVKEAVKHPEQYMDNICEKISETSNIPKMDPKYEYSQDVFWQVYQCNPTLIEKISSLNEVDADTILSITADNSDFQKDSGPNMARINTVPFLYELSNETFLELLVHFTDPTNDGAPPTTSMDEATYEKMFAFKRSMNVMAFVIKYGKATKGNEKLNKLIKSSSILSQADIQYVRSFI